MKSLLPFFAHLAFLPTIAFAAESPATYTLMAPLTGLLGLGRSPNLTDYLQGAVQITIGVAGILAVIMMVYCGLKLMGTPSASGRSEAKECIANAIFGVLLALSAWILLNTINPLLLSSELRLGDVPPPPVITPSGPTTDPYPTRPGWYFKYSDTTGIHYNPAGNSAETCAALLAPAEKAGKTIAPLPDGRKCFEVTSMPLSASESAARTALCGNTSCVGSTPIGINTGPCPSVGATACTNVGGLGEAAVNAIQALPGACGCNIIVSGGTEYWLHGKKSTTQPPPGANYLHAPMNNVFDLKKNTKLDATIKAPGNTKKTSFVNFRWLYNGFWYTEEGDHWHVCQDGLSASYCRS